MVATIIISIITFILITLSILLFPTIKIGKIRLGTYWIIAFISAISLLISSLSPIEQVFDQLTSNNSVNPLKIIVLFFSMTLLSIFLDEVGLFKYLAHLASKRAKNNQFVLFVIFYCLTSALTIFTSNDIVILTFTPFICFFCKNSKINPIPYLVAEFTAANTWSMMLIIGNPTNIYLATSTGLNFFDYLKVMALPTLAAGISEFLLLFTLFNKKLKEPIQVTNEDVKISNKPMLIIGIIHLVICLIFLVISSYIGVEMWIVAASAALSLLICSIITSLSTKKDWVLLGSSLKKLPYQLIPFFLSMFVIVVALNEQGIATKIASFLGNENVIWTYGYSSFLASNLINNIPMSILYSSLISNVPSGLVLPATFASIVGSNIGAFLMPTGALAGIMFTNLVNEHNTKYTFLDFIKYGSIISIPVITIALAVLSVTVSF